ncbi:MAG TPA: glycosyltransferase [Nocardioidaceae bacterium]|nr:glycosyltransferase [Nocardioidaceae bacterium]
MDGISRRVVRASGLLLGIAATVAAVAYLARAGDVDALTAAAGAVLDDPLGLGMALAAYAAAFTLRAWAWQRVLPRLSLAQAWAALHVCLLGNHLLPLRLGEALRVTSVLRRTPLPVAPVVGSAVVLRTGDLMSVAAMALVAGPSLVLAAGGPWTWPLLGLGASVLTAALLMLARMRRRGGDIRTPGPVVAMLTVTAWVLEAAVIFEVARVAGLGLTPLEAVAVTAVTIVAQAVAVTPGGFGTYEAAAAAAMTAAGADPSTAIAVAFVTHAVKTAYSLLLGLVALVWPAPPYTGRMRLPARVPARPAAPVVAADAPVVAVIPVHNEADTVAEVVARLPAEVSGRQVRTLVVDDGSTDASARLAAAAGAEVLSQPANLGLGAAVRRGLAEASGRQPAAVVYLDADLEYDPRELALLASPVLSGSADYVVGSRFAGDIRSMRPHRRFGNQVLTRWVRWMTRRRDLTDGQSGYRAFSPAAAAAAEIVHDYNYAQVLTLDLLGKGFVYAEVPITYAFRESGTSFVRLGRYLRKVVPAVYRELNPAPRHEGPTKRRTPDQHELPARVGTAG